MFAAAKLGHGNSIVGARDGFTVTRIAITKIVARSCAFVRSSPRYQHNCTSYPFTIIRSWHETE